PPAPSTLSLHDALPISRGDGARHVRERSPAQPARRGQRGDVDSAPARRRGDDDLRRGDALPRGGRADDRARGQGVRDGLVTRLRSEEHTSELQSLAYLV